MSASHHYREGLGVGNAFRVYRDNLDHPNLNLRHVRVITAGTVIAAIEGPNIVGDITGLALPAGFPIATNVTRIQLTTGAVAGWDAVP